MFKLSFSLIAIAALAACARPAPTVIVQQPAPSVAVAPAGTVVAPATVVAQAPVLRAGIGRIESIGATPQWSSSSTGGGRPSSMRRIGVRMDDGTLQYLDTNAPSLRTGDRIELTSDGFIRQPAQ